METIENKYALWLLEECDNPIAEINWLYSKLSESDKLQIAIQMKLDAEYKTELNKLKKA